MLALFIIILCMFLAWIGYRFYRSLINPVSLYNLSWVLCVTCNTMLISWYGVYQISNGMYVYVAISCVVFSLVCLIYTSCHPKQKVIKYAQSIMESSINYSLIYVLNVIAIISIIPLMLETIDTLLTQGVYFARILHSVGTGTAFILQDMYKNFVILPVFMATIYLTIDAFIFNPSKPKKLLLFFSIADVILYTLTYLGRWMILQTALFLVMACVVRFSQRIPNFSAKAKKRLKLLKRAVIGIFILLIGVLVFITSYRTTGDDNSILYTIIVYFGGSLSYCDIGISNIVKDGYVLYGLGLFACIWDYPLLVLQKILGIDFLRPQEIVFLYNTPTETIGTESTFNGFGTVILNMFLDGGVIGIIMDSVILAILAMFLYRRMSNDFNEQKRLFGFSSLLMIALVTIQWDGNRIAPMMTFVYMYLYTMCLKKKIKFIC